MTKNNHTTTRREFLARTTSGAAGITVATLAARANAAKETGRGHYEIFQPGQIGKMKLKNRLCRSAAYMNSGSFLPETEGEVTDDTIRIHKAYAEGEVALTMTGYMAVMDYGKKGTHVCASHDRYIPGQKDGDTWKSVIRGGGEVMLPGVGSAIESGPFRVMNKDDDNPVVIENIWLREWACEVVFIEACHGFVFRGNRISHPVNHVDGPIKFVHAIWSSGVNARGDFILENNLVEMGGYEGVFADDEQLCGIFYSNHDNVRVVNNVITGIDEAIEFIGNRYGNSGPGDSAAASTPSEIVVTGNRINITSTPGRIWPSSWAILVAGNLNVDKVIIADNDITTRGKGWGLGLSGDNMQITGNTIRFEEHNGAYPPGAVNIGFGRLAGRDMCSSLNNSVFANNTFEGKVSGSGIRFNERGGDASFDSHGNRFDLGDSLAKLGAETTLALTKDLYDNTFTGDLGTVVDKSPKGANTY